MNYKLNDIARLTADFVNSTHQHVFLTGKAGTGKTTFLKFIVEHTHKKTIVAAPTGIAAINAKGVTLHSLLQLPFGAFIPERIVPPDVDAPFTTLYNLFSGLRFNRTKRQLIQEMELLIIDEVSMLRADLLDCIDHMLRHLRKRKDVPFGGVQLLLIGDLLQLPPVVKDTEWNVLKDYYTSSYFFDAKGLSDQPLIHVELDKIYRQSDDQFIGILNRFRENQQTAEDIAYLNRSYQSNTDSSAQEGYIHLTTHNKKADQINQNRLAGLDGKSYSYFAEIIDNFPENAYPLTEKLVLKEGAQVMFIKNDPSGEGLFFNGKIGIISELSPTSIKVKFEDGHEVIVPEYTWENKRFTLNKNTKEIDEKILGSFKHYPIKLAWAVTVHKSQGLTFERAILDLSGAFTQGQVYVALSRLTSLDGLILSSKIPKDGLEIATSMQQFIAQKPELESLQKRLSTDRLNYLIQMIMTHFDFSDLAKHLRGHVSSFNKEESRSLKQQYLDWTIEMAAPVIELESIGKNFQLQVKKILYQKADPSLFAERVEKAKDYFSERLKTTSELLTDQEAKLKRSSALKTYKSELQELKEHVFDQLLAIHRTALIVNCLSQGKIPAKKDIHQVLQGLIIPKTKKEKTPTHEISFGLYQKGKSIEEIAQERGLVTSTIEGHLCKYIITGEIEAKALMEEEKLKNILSLITQETNGIGEIKAQLGDEYSYGEIKIAMAEWQRVNA
jgi:DNA-binding NarL/FixJ family response regulator